MSQTAFLEDVVSWNEEKCMDQLDEALPRLIACLQEADAIEEEIGILKIICHSFLPCVQQHEAERKVLSKISEKTCQSFDKILSELKTGTGEGSIHSAGEITTSLGMAIEFVDCIESCIRNLLNRKQQMEISHIHSLPGCTIHLLSGSYTHCQDSAELYKELLGMLSEPLSTFFRKAHSLQMAFLNLLDQTIVCGETTEQDLQDLCQVCNGLYEVCQIVTALDMKVVVSLWKAVSKLASQYKELLCGHLDVCRMVRYLCQEITSGYEYLFQLVPKMDDDDGMVQSQGDEKAFVKSLKILGFQMKILVVLVKDFRDFLGQCEKELLSFMIVIYRFLPPSLSAPKLQPKHQEQIRSQIVVAVDPLLTNLVGNRHFRQCITRQDSDVPEDYSLPVLLLLILIMETLPKLPGEEQDNWLSPTVFPEDNPVNNILKAVFSTIGKCFVELALPVYLPCVTIPGKPQRDVSLYDFICTNLCGFIGSLPARHFALLEETLLENCLSSKLNPFLSTLAIDCWCFVARYGSAELCQQHVLLLLTMYQEVTTSPHSYLALHRLSATIHRLLKFLAPQHQQDLFKRYPPKDFLGIWWDIPLHVLTGGCARDTVDELVACCTKNIHNWINSADKRLAQLNNLILSLRCLSNVYSSPATVEKNVTPQQQSVVVEKLSQLWKTFSSVNWDTRPVLELLFATMYRLSGHLVAYFNTSDILQILTVTQRLLSQSSAVVLRLEVVSFLQTCGSAKLVPSFEQSQTLHRLPEVFSQVLKDPHCVVHHQALEAFTRFAEETIHESVVPECMERDASLQDRVVAFLNKMPSTSNGPLLSTKEYLREQLLALSSSTTFTAPQTAVSAEKSYEPSNKRQRTEIEETEEGSRCHSLLQDLQSTCSEVQDLLKSSPQPPWFISSVQQTLSNLSQCLQQDIS